MAIPNNCFKLRSRGQLFHLSSRAYKVRTPSGQLAYMRLPLFSRVAAWQQVAGKNPVRLGETWQQLLCSRELFHDQIEST